MEHLRRTYERHQLDRDQLVDDPFDQFPLWFDEALEHEKPSWLEVNAMTLATTTRDGHVSSRIVLLKAIDRSGFSFFSNYLSRKGQELAINPRASLLFYWPHVERQVRIEGIVSKTDSQTSDGYFQARPRGSQLGAVVSPQSQVIADRTKLEADAQALDLKYEDKQIPRPDYWGGYRLEPESIEFWQGRPNRLHDRFVYHYVNGLWKICRLAP